MKPIALIYGASSTIAAAALPKLQDLGYQVWGISRSATRPDFDRWFQVASYAAINLPKIDQPVAAMAFMPGSIQLKPFLRYRDEDFLNDMECNAFAAARCAQHALPLLKLNGTGSMVFVSSVAARLGMPFHASISMAKSAVEGLTRALAAELAPSVRVNAVAPSLTDTALSERLLSSPEKKEQSAQRHPLKKVGSAEDIATIITLLMSDQTAWVTGQIWNVDGGLAHLKS
jgi:NAD(P)-dependent dehydrogenase (short-subunit alcohol dehydrogenase family)